MTFEIVGKCSKGGREIQRNFLRRGVSFIFFFKWLALY